MPVVDCRAVDADLAARDGFQSRDCVEQRRLAAAGRTDQHQEAALVEREVDTAQGVHVAVVLVEIDDVQ